MHTITIIGGAIVVLLSVMVDPSGTVRLIITIITTRGVTWVVKKIIDSMDRDKGELINFAGWSIAGVAIVKIIKNAVKGVEPAVAVLGKVGDAFAGLGNIIEKLAQITDTITFWN